MVQIRFVRLAGNAQIDYGLAYVVDCLDAAHTKCLTKMLIGVLPSVTQCAERFEFPFPIPSLERLHRDANPL